MKNIINKIVYGSLTFALSSCIANYDNINTEPYQAPDLSPDGYALGSAMNNLAGCVISPDVNTAQFTDCLLGGPLGGYFADSNAGFTETISNFNPKDDWSRVFLKSDKIIPTLYSNLKQIEIVSQNTKDPVPFAIAKVIKVAAMHRVSDAYGPIPYSRIGANGEIATPYDSQEVTYDTFFNELDESIKILNEHSNEQLVPTADYVYKGNVKQWIRFANSLKLRLAIRISYVNPLKSKQMAEEAVNPANGGVIESNVDNAAWNYFETSQNPIYVATRYNQVQDSETGGDTHAAADIICYMNGYKDNRRAKFFTLSEWKDIDYVGMRRGIVIPELKTIGRKYSGVNISPTSPLYWMNAAEVAFLRAEGAAVFNFDMGGTAETFYNQGIRLSFEQWGADGAEAYLNNSENKPEPYVDPAGTNTYSDQISNITIKWDESATPEEKQERIIVQKWIANWELGNEAWADFRRTGYPKLIPVKENKSGGIVDSEKGARRMPYPLDEYVSNRENVEYAIANYLNGPDNMATNVWWASKK
ncbi:RagB/SusD family nutrient uptake outer membrane protein [Coprobacter tertius]|uniref:SusD/RagB family nutrient-binding outer membrane lipoprotein n=1 Tax=Coprobacter tertius TaxID=2944915 RepID=A0ABT1MK48_9BACT|nr:RagB/SusD family nutrient uptake outer membrane protein [Coprobacter tertius]MCP9612236.1 SusD/RagB family nutrient-binding outer membrane lipoprotein [Coprobacter tertius]